MGVSQIPASTASTGNRSWVQLGTSSPTSGSTVSFTSLTAYSFYRVVVWNANFNTSAQPTMRFNNDSGNNYSHVYTVTTGGTYTSVGNAASSGIVFNVSGNTTSFMTDVLIDNTSNLTSTSSWSNWASGNPSPSGDGFWNGNAQINRIDIFVSAASFTSGTITVYGSN